MNKFDELEIEAKRKGNTEMLTLLQMVGGEFKSLGLEDSKEAEEVMEFCEYQLSDEHSKIEKQRYLVNMKLKQLKKLNKMTDAGVDNIIKDIEEVLEKSEMLPEDEMPIALDAITSTIDKCVFAIIM